MDQNKIEFLKNDLVPLLKGINVDTKPLWGKMNVQQMIEHLTGAFKEANGKIPKKSNLPAERVEKMKAFLLSDVPFKENTKNRELAEEPYPLIYQGIDEAISKLEVELNDFFEVFEREPSKVIDNSIFGDLDFEHWVALLYKHAKHHLKQFSVN